MHIEPKQLSRDLSVGDVVKTVGLISDTHVPVRARKIPQAVFETFEKADFIVHAGDLVELAVLDELEELAPVLAIRGNMDRPEVSGALPKMNSLRIFDWKIGVMHNPNVLFGMSKMKEIAKKKGLDVFIYGHTHRSSIKWVGNTLFINPGSATNPIPPFAGQASVGLLRVTTEKISPEIIKI